MGKSTNNMDSAATDLHLDQLEANNVGNALFLSRPTAAANPGITTPGNIASNVNPLQVTANIAPNVNLLQELSEVFTFTSEVSCRTRSQDSFTFPSNFWVGDIEPRNLEGVIRGAFLNSVDLSKPPDKPKTYRRKSRRVKSDFAWPMAPYDQIDSVLANVHAISEDLPDDVAPQFKSYLQEWEAVKSKLKGKGTRTPRRGKPNDDDSIIKGAYLSISALLAAAARADSINHPVAKQMISIYEHVVDNSIFVAAVFEAYDIIGDGIDESSYGVVYKGRCKETGNLVAIKFLRMDEVKVSDVMKEIQIMEIMKDSPYAVTIVDSSINGVAPFIITKWLHGGTLASFIDSFDFSKDHRHKSAPILIHSLLMGQVDHQARNLTHRDYKPDNIMFEKEGDLSSAIVVDYGLATMVADRAIRTNCGTASFKAPEVHLNKGRVPHLEDVYALGIAFGVYLTANSGDYTELVGREVNRTTREVFSPDELRSVLEGHDVCEDAVDLFLKMTEKDPKQRISAVECLNHKYFDGLRSSSGEENTEFNSHWTRRTATMLVEHRQLQTRSKQLEKENRELTKDVKRLSEFETKIAELEEENAKLKAELQDRSMKKMGGLETQFAEMDLVTATATPPETDQASVQTLLGIVLKEWESPLDYKEALGVSASKRGRQTRFVDMFINELEGSGGAGVNFGACAAFVTAWNQEWEVYQGKTELERPNLVEFLSKFPSYRAGLTKALQVNAPIGKKFKDVKKAFPDDWLDGAKNGWLAEAKKASSAIKRKLVEANISDSKTFSSALTKIECAVGEVFDGNEYRDSHGFGLVSASARKTISILLSVIHLSSDF